MTENEIRLDEARWWKSKAYVGHSYDCSLGADDTSRGDFCDCDRRKRTEEIDNHLQELRRLVAIGE